MHGGWVCSCGQASRYMSRLNMVAAVNFPYLDALCISRGGAVHMVLEGSGHDSFNDAVQLVAVHYPRAVAYLRSFKPVSTAALACD